jgi:3'-phosphoadenosine 5'-phosphosulfate sulfotransferase (PAPS reductase)/FAD synthetase
VLVDMAASIDRAFPVISLDTGKLFAETHAYREALVETLRLCDVRVVRPEAATVAYYLRVHNPPRHPLQERAYRSIGCVPCTRAVTPDEPPRAGRWSGLDKSGCGIHVSRSAS